jgi:flagellar hook-basal body complex protein FliE
MSSLAIEQVLAQIRSLSAQTGGAVSPSALRPASLDATAGANGPGFAQLLKQGIDSVNSSQQSADALASAWEKGTPGVDLARVMIETQKASVSFQALTQVRNRLISAYQDIMNMPI